MPAYDGALLRARREALHLPREAVALALGRTASSLHKYESGAVVPPAAVLGDLAALLGCPVSAFFGPGDQDRRLTRLRSTLLPARVSGGSS